MSEEIEAAAAQRVARNTAQCLATQKTPVATQRNMLQAQYTAGSACSYERWVSKQRQAREHDAAVAAQVPAPPRTAVQYRPLRSMQHIAQPHQPAYTAGLRARACRGALGVPEGA